MARGQRSCLRALCLGAATCLPRAVEAAVASMGFQLPSYSAGGASTTSPRWEVQVDNTMYYSPPPNAHGLSSDVSNYYAAFGHKDALTEDLRTHRVGGHGRWHIFHLPDGPSTVGLPRRGGDRHHALTSLMQLEHGQVLQSSFPPYRAATGYSHPLHEEAQQKERKGAKLIDLASMKAFYDGVVNIKDSQGHQTRSYQNPEASSAIQQYLKEQFSSMGLKVCTHHFNADGVSLANVIGYLPGSGHDSVTIGAHYDSRPFEGNAPGAEDNGSGVAALLAVLKAFQGSGFKPKKNLYFVGFAAEEAGLYGSDAFAEQLKSGQQEIPQECRLPTSFLSRNTAKHHALALDEVGWRSPIMPEPTVNLESYDWTKQAVLEHLAQASADHNGNTLKVVHSNNPFGSDHMSWLDRGMNAALVINGDDEGYPDYHMSTDVMANVTPEYTVLISKMILGGLMRMVGHP